MKSAASNKAGLHVAQLSTTSPLSQIPLPRRKNSAKGDKGLDVDDTDGSEYGHDAVAPRSQAKMSLLGSTSFCCASGQKEDYIPDARIVPAVRPPKKRPPNISKKEGGLDPSTPKSPLLAAGRSLLARSKKGKVSQDSAEEIQVHSSETSTVKLSQEDIKLRPGTHSSDSRIRPIDERRKITPPSPQHRIQKEPIVPRRDHPDTRKYSDAIRKYRKDSNPNQAIGDPSYGKAKKCKHTNDANRDSSTNQKLLESRTTENDISVVDACTVTVSACTPRRSELSVKEALSDSVCKDAMVGSGEVLNNAHQSEDFDCPCCDRTSIMMDEAGLSDIEVKMFTSCDVIAPVTSTPQEIKMEIPDTCETTEEALQIEVKSLKEDLQAERLKLQTQQDLVQHLEEELSVMQQLRQELDKEKELRKIAEDKLLELLDYEKRLDVQKKENEKRMESKCTQMDSTEPVHDISLTEKNSPLLFEGRLRKYQTYIAKLEKDNLMLVNELKKFKDMSPRSQEEQAKILVEKLGQMERNNHQQQIQYETCLDEVANKLVQTLLAQKRLEEECKVLHLRVEQLEQENGTLMELIEEDKDDEKVNENLEKEESIKATNAPSTNSNLQHRKPSHHPLTSSSVKKNSTSQKHSTPSEERKKDAPKSTNLSPVKSACSEPRSPVQSPVSPGSKPGCASKIPSFSTTKPLLVRKKSETEMLSTKSKNEVPSREAPSSELVPNSNPSSAPPSSRSKLPSSTKCTKGTSAKRKRFSRNASPSDKGVKESKQRIKSNHIRWEPRKVSPEDIPPPYKSIDCMNELSPIPAFPPPQQVWSFNCEVNTNLPVPEIKRKIADSIEAFSDKLCCSLDHSDIKQNSSTSESSSTIEGANRTRDEGYSTMSSDLQPDSAADTTISEPDPSATYVITEKADHCNSDDSVTECLDGSMCSSSDSGFGPLYQVATLKFPGELPAEEEPSRVANELPKFEISSRKHGTVKSKDQIASVKPTVRSATSASDQSQNSTHSNNKSNTICDNFPCDSVKLNNSPPVSPTKSKRTGDFDILSPSKSPNEKKLPNVDQSTMIDYWNFPKEIVGLKNYRRTWHLGPTKSIYDDQIVFCTRHSYIDDNLFDEKVETAEKATLTEPEEELWREKTLAPFIDESIWSLYSSEGDIQVKHFPLEPLLSEPSLEKLITNCSPCIVVTENLESNPQIEVFDDFKFSTIKSSNNSSFSDLNNISGQNSEKFKSGLERVASDTVLYLKDAIHELENSMRRGLKSSKNIPALHQNSGSESEASPSRGFSLQPEILRTLEATMCEQDHLQWPSPSRSSSLSSLQSSTSCYVVSDEMEDVDMTRSSRKGSQDPDLSSASDTEYENLEHKDFVERWLQKEIVYNNNIPKMVPQLEPVAEIGEFSQKSLLKSSPSVRRKTSLPCDIIDRPTPILTRMRFKSYPTDCNGPKPQLSPPSASAQTSSKSNIHLELTTPDNEKYSTAGNPQTIDSIDDGDFECLDPEAKEFNGDFYTLCSMGSLKSLDRFSPSKTREMSLKQLVESPVFNRKSHPKSLSRALPTKPDRLKPTGLVKPTRPVTLAVNSVPSVPEHSRHKIKSDVPSPSNISDLKANSASKAISKVPCSTDSNNYAKINICPKVPPNNFSVFQNGGDGSQSHPISNPSVSASSSREKSPLTSLPTPLTSEGAVAVKAKSPTKIIFRTGSPSKYEDLAKRQQWKRDRIVARQNRLKEGCGTAWIHLQPNPALSDPSIRNNLLDSIKSPTSSSGSSSTEEDDSEVLVIQTNSHLHRICKERRHKVKASANNPLYDLRKRSSIMGRRELFYRFGDKEKEAIACFDFLEEIPSTSVETLNKRIGTPPGELLPVPTLPPSNLSLLGRKSSSIKERISLISPTVGDISKMATSSNHPSKMADFAKSPFPKYSARQLRLPNLWNKPLSHNMSSATLNSQDCELLDHISLSDSCAESYSSTPESYDDAS